MPDDRDQVDRAREDSSPVGAADNATPGMSTAEVSPEADRDEWSMHVSPQMLGHATAGAAKDALLAKHLDKVNAGHNKSKSDARADGWI